MGEVACWEELEELLSPAAAHVQHTGHPWVTVAYAQSLDGSLAARPGRPLLLSGKASMTLTHQLRARHQGILVGIGTLLADDPRLTVRLAVGDSPQPVVLDSHLRMPPDCRLMAHPRKPWVLCGEQAEPQRRRVLEQAGARLLPLPLNPDGRLPLPAVLDTLGQLGLGSLMVEGGAGVLSSFLRQRLGQCAVLTLAPVWVDGVRLSHASEEQPFPRLVQTGSAWIGEDLVVWGRLA